jgi:anti-sigma B factor antagonist
MNDEEKAALDPTVKRFAVSSEVVNGATVIAVRGELDLSTAPDLEESIRAAGEAGLVFDLGGCDFIDSTGIALLVRTSREASEAGRKVALCGLKEQVLRVLEIAAVEDLIPTRNSREEALAVVSA